MLQHGLDILSTNLEFELSKPLAKINRKIKGFEDFALEGVRGIEARSPARSLLYHALASPNVTVNVKGKEFTAFPTLDEIEIIENYVFGVKPPLIEELQGKYTEQKMVIAVFAVEYRNAQDTVHGKHADLCFSRTGVTRIGTHPAEYNDKVRGFLPFVQNDEFGFRVLPARYSAYIAVQQLGNKESFGPLNFQKPSGTALGDESKNFWVPIHKLFDGNECLQGLELNISFNNYHQNTKIRSIHENAATANEWTNQDLYDEFPFTIVDGIAEISTNLSGGSVILTPVPHAKLVEPALYNGKDQELRGKTVAFIVNNPERKIIYPQTRAGKSTGKLGYAAAPELVHIRTQLIKSTVIPPGPPEQVNLNTKENIMEFILNNYYEAINYVDYTGDGWVSAKCPELLNEIPWSVKAYSIVAPPDFYPYVGQRRLFNSIERNIPTSEGIWLPNKEPQALSDQRYAPNIRVAYSGFKLNDKTITSIISLENSGQSKQTRYTNLDIQRRSFLPDEAAAIFEPGADVGLVEINETEKHLASFRLSSPFPEDTKLCAAISTYWPAAVPDAARSMDLGDQLASSNYPPTVVPLTDEELGQVGNIPWDGIKGPKVIKHQNKEYAEYLKDEYADYVLNTLENKFSLALVGRVGFNEYRSRLFSQLRVYKILRTEDLKNRYRLLSFRRILQTDAETVEAQKKTGKKLNDSSFLYRFEMFKPRARIPHPNSEHFQKTLVEISERTILLVDPTTILVKVTDNWSLGIE